MIYLKTTLRTLLKNKIYSFVNIMGLSLAIGCSYIIYLYVNHELSFERHLENFKNIYRVVYHFDYSGDISKRTGSPYPMSEVLSNDFSEIKKSCLVRYGFNPSIKISKDGAYSSPKTYDISFAHVEPDYDQIFSVKWLEGGPSALQQPNSVILTKTFSESLFGHTRNIIGKQLDLNYGSVLTVLGIIEDPVSSSEFDMDMLVSFSSLKGHDPPFDSQEWGFTMGTMQAYILLNDEADKVALKEKLDGIPEKYIRQDWASSMEVFLQPLSDMHYNPEYQVLTRPAVTKRYIWILASVGIFLLVIACINYINLSTAFAMKNQKVGAIRKAMGCSRIHLMKQSIYESSVLTLIALSLGLSLSYRILIFLKNQIDFEPGINLSLDFSLLIFAVGVLLVSGIISGVYPAILHIKTETISAIKGSNNSGAKGIWTRRILVVAQFAIAQTLIIAIIMLIRQIDFVENRNLGFDNEGIVNVPLPINDEETLQQFRDRLSQYPEIESVTFAVAPPSDVSYWGGTYDYYDGDVRTEITSHIKFVDKNYLDTYGLQLLAGTDFKPSDTTRQVIVNKEFALKMGMPDAVEAVGERIDMYGTKRLVVGVIENFHAQSLHEKIPPVVLLKSTSYLQTAGIKINRMNTRQSLARIQKEWEEVFPGREYSYSFLDETIHNFYESDRNKSTLLNLFAWVSIIIACLGIYGLVSFLTNQKVKEIGIRKVLGASVLHLLTLFSKEFIVLVISALVISIPIGYLIVNNWLEDFPYRVETHPLVFGITGILTVIIALLTVSFQSFKAARANPVESLRME